ncbi:MAG: HNH endonuclease [Actinomycetota bacterium]|nr:HNH endonuclease [Actinomycetota bacterium]
MGIHADQRRHPVAQACDRFAEIVDDLGAPALWSASDADIGEIVAAAEQVARRVAAVQAAAVAEGVRRGLPSQVGAAGSTGWLSGLLTVKPQHANRVCRLAAGLAAVPATAAKLATGGIDADQAQVIAGAVGGLPDEVGAELRVTAEAWLLDQAEVHHAGVLAGLAGHLLEVVAPEVAEAKLAERLEREEQRAADRCDRLSAQPNWRGRMTVRGDFDPDTWGTVAAALDPFTKPAPVHDPDAVQVRDPRRYDQRLADGLVEVARRQLVGGTLPVRGGKRPQVVVTIDHDRLVDQVGLGLLDSGVPVTAATARRIACDAQLISMVLGANGVPLDVGRSERLFSGELRAALVARDRGCAFPGCTRPPDWCEGHHIVHWADGGSTSLANAALLCGHHHRVVHRGQWQIQMHPHGRPEFLPPAHLDPQQRPRSNTIHLRL